ncbi:MAG TPA: iron-sulfur cluster assembly accessory protein [Fimbriimonadaceae bacterium]|nr:iron-sulfur cluster assembly accessory protein [Fimbriimonadaceae bacterium]
MGQQTFPVEVTPEALKRLKALMERKGEPGAFVRLGVKGGGCSGLEYVLRLDTQSTPYDVETELDGLKVVSDSKSAKFIAGSKLVWTGNLAGAFKFENPNAERSCGCGTSFTPKKPAS